MQPKRIDIQVSFREDIPSALEALREVHEVMRERVAAYAGTRIGDVAAWEPIEVRIDHTFIALSDPDIMYICEVVAKVGRKVSVTLWVDPEGEPYADGRSLWRLGGSYVLNEAARAGIARLGRQDAEVTA
jgi:hypothetical protein